MQWWSQLLCRVGVSQPDPLDAAAISPPARVIRLFDWSRDVRDRRRHYYAGLPLKATRLPQSARRRIARAVRLQNPARTSAVQVGDLDRLWCQHRGEFHQLGLTGPVLVMLCSWYEGWSNPPRSG